jgi:hypothetical protein
MKYGDLDNNTEEHTPELDPSIVWDDMRSKGSGSQQLQDMGMARYVDLSYDRLGQLQKDRVKQIMMDVLWRMMKQAATSAARTKLHQQIEKLNRQIGVSEGNMLIDISDRKSLDPAAARQPRMDHRVIKGVIEDHLQALRSINADLGAGSTLDAALDGLQAAYDSVLGQKLSELMTGKSIRLAVSELHKRLHKLVRQASPDLSYANIDSMMRNICTKHACSPHSLHDFFMERFSMTPDDWAKTQLVKIRKQQRDKL